METIGNQKLLIHIGYHKTGSSFLQKLIFSNPECGFYSPWSPRDYIAKLIICNPFAFDSSSVRSFFEPGIIEAWKNSQVPVISHEMLSGNPWKGEYNSQSTADRLRATFPEGKVLIVIREQKSMILSFYKHRVRSYLAASIEQYLEEPTPAFEPLFRLEYLEYHWLIAYYQKLFGRERVLVLPQEMLKLDKSLFLNSIATFAGTDIPDDAGQEVVKQGYSAFTVALKRWTNLVLAPKHARRDLPWYQRFNNFAFRHLDQVVPKALDQFFTQKLKVYIENRIGNYYENSNRITTELIGIDLQAYGYPVKSE